VGWMHMGKQWPLRIQSPETGAMIPDECICLSWLREGTII